jgi:hypothetical protein
MIFDRISLVSAYRALNYVNSNDGRVANILFNKKTFYGTKTTARFQNLTELKTYIDLKFPYQYNDSQRYYDATQKTIYNLLTFSVYMKDIDTQAESKHAVFVNNIRNGIESVNQAELNDISAQELQKVFSGNLRLNFLKDNATYESYITSQDKYLDPSDYIALIPDEFYTELINKHYKLTQDYNI